MSDAVTSVVDLKCYPPEILGTILANYCDRRDITNVWFAILGSEEYVEFLWPLMVHDCTHAKLNSFLQDQQLVDPAKHHQRNKSRKRTRRMPACLQTLIQDELNNSNTIMTPGSSSTLLDQRKYQTRRLLQRLKLVEYQERLPGVLWSGRMEFSVPREMRFFQEERLTASVKLCCYGESIGGGSEGCKMTNLDDVGGCDKEMNAWSFVNLRSWNTCFPEWLHVVQLRSQPYNFVPIPPYGRLQGISAKDKIAIQRVRSVLEESDQVMTLIVRNNRLILRIISPQQARRRLEAFPSMASKFEQLTKTEGLLCCWERTERWEDELKLGYTLHEDKLEAIASILTRYHSSTKDPSLS